MSKLKLEVGRGFDSIGMGRKDLEEIVGKVPARFKTGLRKIAVKRIPKKFKNDYYGGHYDLINQSISVFIPEWSHDYGCFLALNGEGWTLKYLLNRIKTSTIPHELGHHISLTIIGYSFVRPKRNSKYWNQFYKEEEERAEILEDLIRKRAWTKIDSFVQDERLKLEKNVLEKIVKDFN